MMFLFIAQLVCHVLPGIFFFVLVSILIIQGTDTFILETDTFVLDTDKIVLGLVIIVLDTAIFTLDIEFIVHYNAIFILAGDTFILDICIFVLKVTHIFFFKQVSIFSLPFLICYLQFTKGSLCYHLFFRKFFNSVVELNPSTDGLSLCFARM